MTDIVFIHPGAQRETYGVLDETLTALEPPRWALILASSFIDKGYEVKIVDQEAEGLSAKEVAQRVREARIAVIVVHGHQPSASTSQMVAARDVAQEIHDLDHTVTGRCQYPRHRPVIVMLGNHPSALPEHTLRDELIDFVIDGEGPTALESLSMALSLGGGIYQQSVLAKVPGLVWWGYDETRVPQVRQNPLPPLLDMDRDLHGSSAWHLLDMSKYRAHNWQVLGGWPRAPYASIHTTLGCAYKCHFCLSGDTLVDTVYGQKPIKDLIGQEIPVFTLDYENRKGKISRAINIRQYGRDRLVRVSFDDGSHLDCTPDHQLLWFNGKNRYWPTQAIDLKVGDRICAMTINPTGAYPKVKFSGAGGEHIHRLSMEYNLGRELLPGEVVHHVDENKTNYVPENLELLGSHSEHAAKHDFGARVREYWNNTSYIGPEPPVKNPRRVAASKAREKSQGKKCWWTEADGSIHLSSRPRAAGAVRGKNKGVWWTAEDGSTYQSYTAKNPADKRGRVGFSPHKNWAKSDEYVNHKIAGVEYLDGIHDVFCLDVPDTGWFYANNVLVKNCMINIFQHDNKYRRRDPVEVVSEITRLYHEYGVKTFKFTDELFVLNRTHYRSVCELLEASIGADINIWAYARTDTVDQSDLRLMRAAGIRWLALGIESGSARVRAGANKKLRGNHDSNGNIEDVVEAIRDAGINVIGNYIFGLSDDTHESMRQTLDLALDLNTEWANFYCAMPYPGSPLYDEVARDRPQDLPPSWSAYSQHNRHCRPLRNENLTAAQILSFRDNAFRVYFSSANYRAMILRKFGYPALEEVDRMLSYELERDLLR